MESVLWHSPDDNFTKSAHNLIHNICSDIYTYKIITTSSRGATGQTKPLHMGTQTTHISTVMIYRTVMDQIMLIDALGPLSQTCLTNLNKYTNAEHFV